MKTTIMLLLLIGYATTVPAQDKNNPELDGKTARVIVTAENSDLRLSPSATLAFKHFPQPLETQPCIFIDPSKTFQTFIGIGGAITDAAAETFAKLPADKQEEFMKAYFDREEGIGYGILRTNIHSCDFSSYVYTYVDDGDISLQSFSIDHDLKYRIPMIRRANETAGRTLPLFASPWSPPAWMKDNNNMLKGGKLLPEFYPAWASYFVKFIQGYEQQGIPVWGITVQNEPMATQTWESCIFTAEEERDFIRDHLGPALWKSNLNEKKLIAWDHNRDLIYHRASVILGDPEASKYVWGIGFHWYESWTGAPIYDNVKRVSDAFPDKPLLLTEACNFPFSWDTFNQWHWGENYGESMINDFNNGAVAWTDWNMLLDETGGPNHVGNFCFAPVHAKTGEGTLHYMNSYYYIGHFSKFILPGAKRISCSPSRAQLMSTAFMNPDGTIVVVVMNKQDTAVGFRMYLENYAFEAVSAPHSVMTFIF